jgi:sugar-specific transcriptional regulator TrmB
MATPNLQLLADVGLTLYERKALAALVTLGVADAAGVCRVGAIPTSKIYRAMEKLAQLGLAQIQPTRPRMYAAFPADLVVERLVKVAKDKAERFETEAEALRPALVSLAGRVRGRQTFIDLALGAESHVKRHMIHLGSAKRQILSYLEQGDIIAIDRITQEGFPILRQIARNSAKHNVDHKVIFGFSYRTASILVAFLKRHRNELRHITGVRYSGELGHPFHVIDDETVVLPLDHPFIHEGRFASLLVRDRELAQSLTEGFQQLWRKAMRELTEVDFDPRGSRRRHE